MFSMILLLQQCKPSPQIGFLQPFYGLVPGWFVYQQYHELQRFFLSKVANLWIFWCTINSKKCSKYWFMNLVNPRICLSCLLVSPFGGSKSNRDFKTRTNYMTCYESQSVFTIFLLLKSKEINKRYHLLCLSRMQLFAVFMMHECPYLH